MFPFIVDIRNLDATVDSLTVDDLARYGQDEQEHLDHESC